MVGIGEWLYVYRNCGKLENRKKTCDEKKKEERKCEKKRKNRLESSSEEEADTGKKR